MYTQWRVAPDGRAIGLDYTAIQPVLRLMKIKRGHWPALFEDIRIMERAAKEKINAR